MTEITESTGIESKEIEPSAVRIVARRIGLFGPVTIALVCIWRAERWILMCGLALALWLGLKSLVLCNLKSNTLCITRPRLFIWFAGWPGMDGWRFFDSNAPQNGRRRREESLSFGSNRSETIGECPTRKRTPPHEPPWYAERHRLKSAPSPRPSPLRGERGKRRHSQSSSRVQCANFGSEGSHPVPLTSEGRGESRARVCDHHARFSAGCCGSADIVSYTQPALKTLAGAGFIWVAARRFYPQHDLLSGWIGMIGFVLLLHFGFFELLSMLWRACGIDLEPIMRAPLLSTSLAEFWGRRWNTGFSIPARRLLLLPLSRAFSARTAGFVIFLISGSLHELVITLPAGGGYGLPSAYFALQGLGTVLQGSRYARRGGLNTRVGGWISTLLIAGLPACLLFPPVFIRNVILPMLLAFGAIGGKP